MGEGKTGSVEWMRRLIGAVDRWMERHPWHPRLVPYAVYGVFLVPVGVVREHAVGMYPLVYAMQCGLVMWLLWRYRRLVEEMNWRFHWLAVPAGVGVFYAWVWLGVAVEEWGMVRERGLWRFTVELTQWMVYGRAGMDWVGQVFGNGRGQDLLGELGRGWGELAMGLRLAGMTVVVPMFEELFVRSLVLRSFQHPRRTAIGLVQVIHDLPLVGEWLVHTDLAYRAHRHPAVFGREFLDNPLGKMTVFGVMVSTGVFMLGHLPRDYAGAVACGLAYCLVVWATNRPGKGKGRGLGPVIWAHAITNALLWVYTVRTGDWRFL